MICLKEGIEDKVILKLIIGTQKFNFLRRSNLYIHVYVYHVVLVIRMSHGYLYLLICIYF